MINVEIITIGDELLIGQVIDTNSAWIAQRLNKVGLDVKYKTTVGDNETDMLDAFERACSRVSVVLLTGGIGPTKDDITKRTLCKFFDSPLVFDETTLATIQEMMKRNNRSLNELTRDQAYVPQKATVIQNRMGTAPCTWFEQEGKVLVSMPGVPYEMKWLMEEEIIPRLKRTFPNVDAILHQTFWVGNYSESMLALKLDRFENELPETIKLAYLPTAGLIRLRLTGKSNDKELLNKQMQHERTKLLTLLSTDIISEDDSPLEQILHHRLIEKGLTLALAESCTGGMLASLFTAIPGSSQYFNGGAVTYANQAKVDLLGVDEADIERVGVVSREVVEQMAAGAKRVFHADCAIATSGIAGPGGGSPEKPVGTVWIAVSYGDQTLSQLYHFTLNRETNIQRACNMGMKMLLELL